MSEFPRLVASAMLRRLVAHGVDFVVIGGVASILHGSATFTRDLDVTYAPDDTNLEQLGAALIELGAKLRGVEDELPFVPDARTLRRTSILCLETSEGVLDVLATPDGAPPYGELRARADRFSLGDFAVLVANVDDLISMKRAAGRPKDLAAIAELEAIRRLSEASPR